MGKKFKKGDKVRTNNEYEKFIGERVSGKIVKIKYRGTDNPLVTIEKLCGCETALDSGWLIPKKRKFFKKHCCKHHCCDCNNHCCCCCRHYHCCC